MVDGDEGASLCLGLDGRPGSIGTGWSRWLRGTKPRRRTLERSRLFDQDAERYDRCRPRYPRTAVIDELLGPGPCRSRGARRGVWHRDRGTADG